MFAAAKTTRPLLMRSLMGRSIPCVGTATSRIVAAGGGSTATMQQQQKWFSDSHDDFAPQRKTVDGASEALAMIKDHVTSNPVMLYMKGNPSMPMCGFSARVVQVLQSEGVDFSSVNVLDYPAIREGVKEYSEWPTIPQLYVNGEFVGGCDIIESMHEAGELKELLSEVPAAEK